MAKKRSRVLIVGGGFGGLATALALSKHTADTELEITLLSDKPHFEYHAALYRVVTGKSPLEVCIPVSEILKHANVNFDLEKVTSVDAAERMVRGESGRQYPFDYLVLALGSETAYFKIPGLETFSYGFKSIQEAMRLKRHLHEVIGTCAISDTDTEEDLCRMHLVIVGGGPSGVELAAELAVYARRLAKNHGVDPRLLAIDIIDSAPRILPMLPSRVSEIVAMRLRALGVNLFLNRPMLEGKIREIMVRGMTMHTETIIWTAGVAPNALYASTGAFRFDKKGRVEVDVALRAKGHKNIFVIGDGAATQYSGMAQTAIHDGKHVAAAIPRLLRKQRPAPYIPKRPAYSIPVGPGWAATMFGSLLFTGYLGWIFRRAIDFRFFLSILPFGKALTAFRCGKRLTESCPACAEPTSSSSPR
ncbi:FAD-dependent oxidoreductase [Candidatus Uhrbacteria bacterium]|nr:FAD-dependent oxidoreductase [Candidatus Uhrbacteria bacterium]